MASHDSRLFARNIGVEMFHKQGLAINRPRGSGDYVFIHFLTAVEFVIDKKPIREKAGCCILYTPPKPQFYHSPANANFGNDWMHFAGSAAMPLLRTLNIPVNRPFRPVGTAFIAGGLRRINDEKVRRAPHWEVGMDTSIRGFLLELARNIKTSPKSPTSRRTGEMREELLKLRALLQESCYESWSLEKMAEKVHLSCSRFSVLYRQTFRTSPISDLLHMRIELAKYYLGMMQMNVDDVAESCGFASIYYFHRQFKKIVGMTPRTFQRTYRGDDLHPPHHASGGIWP